MKLIVKRISLDSLLKIFFIGSLWIFCFVFCLSIIGSFFGLVKINGRIASSFWDMAEISLILFIGAVMYAFVNSTIIGIGLFIYFKIFSLKIDLDVEEAQDSGGQDK